MSFVIGEFNPTNDGFTKALTFKFNGKCEYSYEEKQDMVV